MIKVAINGLASYLEEQVPTVYTFLKEIGIIDKAFQAHNEINSFVSSAVDLENSLRGGLEKIIFDHQHSPTEADIYDRPQQGVMATFQVYGHWRQITSHVNQ